MDDLLVRKQMCEMFIRTLEEMRDDPRQPEALAHYKAQLAEIERKIAGEKPPAVVVGLKSARLFSEAPKEN